MQNRENDIVLFMDENIQLEVPLSQDGESVWLSANQMAVLFDKDETNIRKHVNNIFKSSEVDKNNNTQKMRVDGVKQSVAFYSLDVILAVGYRVNSKRGIAFRKWANNVLKQYIATVYKGNIIKNLIMDCQSYTKYRPNETTGGIFVSWRRKEELPTGA